MAAGLGFKTFVTGEVLTAADTNGYLMQGINVFATTAARNAAITAPAEGQFAFTKDTNSLWYYDGAAWVASGATGDIEGVTAGIGISGGGTSGTVTVTNSMATAIDAKGDLVAGTGADAFSRLAVGANNTVLTADSAQATGLKWATPSGAATTWTLLNSGGTALTGSTTVTVSSISAKELMIFVDSACSATSYAEIKIRVNSISTADYSTYGIYNVIPSAYASGNWDNYQAYSTDTSILLGQKGNSTTSVVSGACYIDKTDQTGNKIYQLNGSGDATASAINFSQMSTSGLIEMSAAITSVSIISTAGNLNGGTVYILGAS
jgi:hypothetical protein